MEGADSSFYTASGLETMGIDEADTELGYSYLEVGGILSRLFYVEAFMPGGHKDGMAVEVKGLREAVTGEDFIAEPEVGHEVFSVAEEAVEGLSGGIVQSQDKGIGLSPNQWWREPSRKTIWSSLGTRFRRFLRWKRFLGDKIPVQLRGDIIAVQ